jgi:hypothetical protein
MKKAEKPAGDGLRAEYIRSDFGALVRGKYVKRLQANANVAIVDPEAAGVFPNAAAGNAALRSLAEIARRAAAPRRRPRR